MLPSSFSSRMNMKIRFNSYLTYLIPTQTIGYTTILRWNVTLKLLRWLAVFSHHLSFITEAVFDQRWNILIFAVNLHDHLTHGADITGLTSTHTFTLKLHTQDAMSACTNIMHTRHTTSCQSPNGPTASCAASPIQIQPSVNFNQFAPVITSEQLLAELPSHVHA